MDDDGGGNPLTLKLGQFDPSRMATSGIIVVIIGKRVVGKTALVKDMLRRWQCQYVTVLTAQPHPHCDKGNEYAGVVPDDHIIRGYSEQVVDAFVGRQQKHRHQGSEHACIVFEDCMHKDQWTRHRSVNALFVNGRCLRTTCVFVMKYPLALPPCLRANIDFVFVFTNMSVGDRRRIYKMYCGMFPSFEVFCQTLNNVERIPFACLVIDNMSNSTRLEDQVMIYVAPATDWRAMVERKKEVFLDPIREELMQRTWHPSRVRQCLDCEEEQAIFQP